MLRLSLLTVAILAQAGAAWSIPLQVGYGSVVSGVVENFEASPAGPLPDAPSGPIIGPGGSSAPFEGFQFTSLFPYVASISDSAPSCASGLCLVLGISPLYSPIAGTPNPPTTAVFDELASGTKSFGLKVAPASRSSRSWSREAAAKPRSALLSPRRQSASPSTTRSGLTA